MRTTRAGDKKAQPSTSEAQHDDRKDIIYTEASLVPEVWVVNGSVNSAKHLELITLPDPKTSEPRRFVRILRPDPWSKKGSVGRCGMRATLGELRTFETATPASFLVQSEDMPADGAASDCKDVPENSTIPAIPEIPAGCDQEFLDELGHPERLAGLTLEDDWRQETERLTHLQQETQLIVSDFEQSNYYVAVEEEAGATEQDIASKRARAIQRGMSIIESGTYEQGLGERRSEESRRVSYLEACLAYCQAKRKDAREGESDTPKSDRVTHDARVFTTKQTLHMVTDIDLVFMLLPVLCPAPDARNTGIDSRNQNRFLPLDDIMESWGAMKGSQAMRLLEGDHQLTAETTSTHADLTIRADIEHALQRICDSVDAGGETAYRFDPARFQSVLIPKAKRLAAAGLPQSLEERAMKLVENSQCQITSDTETSIDTPSGVDTPGELSMVGSDTQESAASAVFSQDADSNITSQPTVKNGVTEETETLVRIRVALGYILANYAPEHVSKTVIDSLNERNQEGLDFKPLQEHIQRKREAEKRVDVSGLYSNKRGADDEERMEERAEKKRKLEEEEKKKKEASHGVKALAKVNTKGMMKMTSFFQAKPKKA